MLRVQRRDSRVSRRSLQPKTTCVLDMLHLVNLFPKTIDKLNYSDSKPYSTQHQKWHHQIFPLCSSSPSSFPTVSPTSACAETAVPGPEEERRRPIMTHVCDRQIDFICRSATADTGSFRPSVRTALQNRRMSVFEAAVFSTGLVSRWAPRGRASEAG